MAKTTVPVEFDTRDELRKYKAEHGITYDEAVIRLLKKDGWYDE